MTRDELKKEFQRSLRKMIIERCMTYRELAEKTGISLDCIYAYSCGRRMPNLYTAVVIADALNCSLLDLIGE